MLTYSFTETSGASLYEHLYKCIKNDILTGVLKADEKLPSKRTFAKNLGISTITIENAYAQLMAEGYIYSLPKKGYYIADIGSGIEAPIHKGNDPKLPDYTKPGPDYLADFTSNQTSAEYFPFSIWSRLIRQQLSDRKHDLLINPPCGGILYLREAIADHLKDFHGAVVQPQQIIIGAGTEYLYGILTQLIGIDKRYAVEDPGYAKMAKIYKAHHVACIHIPMDHNGIRVEDLRKEAIHVAHISPSHQFPTGITMSIGRRHELLKWATEAPDRYIIEDDYDSEFRLSGQIVPTLQSIDKHQKVIYINTFTKTLSSTARIAYMVLPPQLVTRFYSDFSFYSCPVSNFEQYTLGTFIKEGYFEKHINRLRNHYRKKLDYLLRTIHESPLSEKVAITKEEAGLHFLMKVQTSMKDSEFCELADHAGIRLLPLSSYFRTPTPEAEHTFVMNYTSLSDELIPETVRRLSTLIEKE